MRSLVVAGTVAVAVLVSACAIDSYNISTHYLELYAKADPSPASFDECHGFNCAERSEVSLRPQEWRRVTRLFARSAPNARAERRRIAEAVALMQKIVGAKTGTGVHQWTHKNLLILPNLSDPTQLDCVDEAVNTWTYMTMMEQARLFRFHHVAKLSYAGSLSDPNTRNTAVLQEKGGAYYSIDPSLVDVGVPAPVFLLSIWLQKWPPDLSSSETPVKLGT